MRKVHENLLNKNSLPHTVAECVCTSCLQKYTERIWFVPHCCRMYLRREHESLLKEYGLPHIVAEWYECRKHKSLPKEYGCC